MFEGSVEESVSERECLFSDVIGSSQVDFVVEVDFLESAMQPQAESAHYLFRKPNLVDFLGDPCLCVLPKRKISQVEDAAGCLSSSPTQNSAGW